MHSLGLNIGHNATAALAVDGEIVACVSEERFARIKNYWGVPKQSINWLLKEYNVTPSKLGKVVVNAHTANGHLHLNKALTQQVDPTFRAVPKDNLWNRLKYAVPAVAEASRIAIGHIKSARLSSLEKQNRRLLAQLLRVSPEKVVFLEHHTAHALSCAYQFYAAEEKWLIFTLDGEGDDLCATVNVWDQKKLKRVASTPAWRSIGKFYEGVTEYLGMKSFEHEYKVMGLAPYAKEKYVKQTYKKMKKLISLNDLTFTSLFPMDLSYFWLQQHMKHVRFDNVAGAAQMLVEELLSEWVRRACKHYNISRVALAGGVFMNVKANKRIMELDEVEQLYVIPSCADESLALANAWYGCDLLSRDSGKQFSPVKLRTLYLGSSFDNDFIKKVLTKRGIFEKYTVEYVKSINKRVAQLLADNHIVARCSGRMEFGARALGNRSILSNPTNYDNVRVLNEMIKNRDFWMPFTPSILKSRATDYVVNPKQIAAPYMIFTFDGTEKAEKDLIAAMHPYDFTTRPQLVERSWNKDYYEVLKEFEKLTGVGGLLNTSFNVHGLPIARTPEDALYVLEHSALPYLVMGNWLISKKK